MPNVTETLAPIGVWDNLKPTFGSSDFSNGLQQLHSSSSSISELIQFASSCSGAFTAMNTNNLPLGNIQLPGANASAATFNPEDLDWSAFTQQMNPGNKELSWNSAGMPHGVPSGYSPYFQFAANMAPRFHQRTMNPNHQVSHFGGNVARDDAGVFSPEEAAELLGAPRISSAQSSGAPPPLYRRHHSDSTGTGQYHRSVQSYDPPRRRQSDSSVSYPAVHGNAGANFSSFTTFPEFNNPEFGVNGGLAGIPGAQPPGDVTPRQRKRRTTDSGHQGGVLCCQIADCLADLSDEKPYCRRYKLCRKCMNRDSLLVCGREMRFCQQCSFLHHLTDFDGQKRSCREKLQKHALRVRKSRAAAAAAQALADVSSK